MIGSRVDSEYEVYFMLACGHSLHLFDLVACTCMRAHAQRRHRALVHGSKKVDPSLHLLFDFAEKAVFRMSVECGARCPSTDSGTERLIIISAKFIDSCWILFSADPLWHSVEDTVILRRLRLKDEWLSTSSSTCKQYE